MTGFRTACSGFLALLFLPGAVQAMEPPAEVVRAYAGVVADCGVTGVTARDVAARALIDDFNGDGRPDWVLHYSEVCPGMASFFCGSAGCLTQIFVSRPGGGHNLVLDTNVQDFLSVSHRGRPAIRLSLHGSACGRPGAEECRKIYFVEADRLVPAD